MVLLK
jgi:hypothetical protein